MNLDTCLGLVIFSVFSFEVIGQDKVKSRLVLPVAIGIMCVPVPGIFTTYSGTIRGNTVFIQAAGY